jgi:hypothetical protein
MALFPRTPKEESQNYPELKSQDFENSYLLAPTSDWSEVWTKIVTLLESFPTQCRTPFANVGIISILDNLTPAPSFAHNLGCRCPNGTYKAILDICTSRPFHWYKEHLNARCFDPWTRALSFQESRKTPTSHFWECGFYPHSYPKVGLRHSHSQNGDLGVLWDS